MSPAHFARRAEKLQPSSIRKMMIIAKRLISEGRTVFELNIGQPDVPCIPVFLDAIAARGREGRLNYAPFIGENCLRQAYARYLNDHFDRRGAQHLVVDSENVLVTCGASHALTSTFLSICDPGDEILCVEPFFPPYTGFLGIADGVLRSIPTYAEQGFALPTIEEMERYITPKTRALLFTSPSNPSGKILSPQEVTRLARLALKFDIFLIADEVYREMVLGDREAFSILQVDLEPAEMERLKHRIIVIDSASKAFSLCGARIGFVISRPEIIQKISLVNAHTVACVSDILQHGVAVAYEHVIKNPSFFTELRRTYRERLEAAMEAIHKYLPWAIVPRPDGAFYVMIQFPEIEDITEYCLFMLEKFNVDNETVAVTPAASFYLSPGRGRNEMRLALVVSPEKIKRSIFIMAEAYKAYKAYLKEQGKDIVAQNSRRLSNNDRGYINQENPSDCTGCAGYSVEAIVE
ncbi:MAG: aminotransferase class I/II-fold pyridoxal phosphate-dependent enzyme [Candidatus Riflebacteria bacterium]|nr:aminotransferase class I/II-fold pyridoxal phosphate-dependent enzyme [Candidatus Riflebacteria bacterium]